MHIAGFVKLSLIDYPAHLASVVFTPGCNFRCYYCHNRALVDATIDQGTIDPNVVFEHLEKRKNVVQALVISGGEPTLQPKLLPFMRHVKKMGFRIKLDTNGSRPCVLENLFNASLVDYVAMDIKAPLDRYEAITLTEQKLDRLQKSMQLIRAHAPDYEFRTTIAPDLSLADIKKMVPLFTKKDRLVLQQYKKPENTDSLCDVRVDLPAHGSSFFQSCIDILSDHVKKVDSRGVSV